MNYLKIKRILDVIFALLGLIFLSPLLLLITILIKLDSQGPVIFRQKRFGQHRKVFYILKFRTMKLETPSEVPTFLLENPEECITRTGKYLRKSSLDELPQLVNILKGEMSFVGPRPVVCQEISLIEERDRYHANEVPVGLTGWAQINGRDQVKTKEKARLDGEYVEKIGFWMDFKCLLLTATSLFNKDAVVEGKQDDFFEE
ncbi:sugar transferase [Enterococcus lemanii]|uniref:Sugar transferase n=1 Tax=Enterococcus lemanii TaxID=1159752 RepID=A0ABV9MU35_9ENTE|nr:sugar transferase [Enterococcus lemanii]MBM7709070.1 O-antigen biosynthesis protein WbqP [Enterococcus lemanii]